jgi:hypothetical protein|tara:strand:+ start:232 stop:588 length:357 start_codon:yes stop_codon:yes gene_type:complete
MKKAIVVIAMLFSVAITSQNKNFIGIWEQDHSSEFYTVIISDEDRKFRFIKFSFYNSDKVKETVLNVKNNKIYTIIKNPANGWKVFCKYEYIDINTLKRSYYAGDYIGTHKLYRKKIN